MRPVRLRMDVAYDGTDFKGWATQPRLRTVQGTLEAALATALRVPAARLVCAGRTDSGVHARGQVVHLDADPGQPLEVLARRVNGIHPDDAPELAADPGPPVEPARENGRGAEEQECRREGCRLGQHREPE